MFVAPPQPPAVYELANPSPGETISYSRSRPQAYPREMLTSDDLGRGWGGESTGAPRASAVSGRFVRAVLTPPLPTHSSDRPPHRAAGREEGGGGKEEEGRGRGEEGGGG